MARDYRAELDHGIAQFKHYLELMHDRAFEEVRGCCYICFEERRPRSACGSRKQSGEKKATLELTREASNAGIGGAGDSGESAAINLPDEGWRQDDSKNRFIQLSIEHDWFCVDLPRKTLYRPEAEQILRRRQGFFYLRDRPEFTLYGEDIDGYDPFRKIYIYGDEESATQDMAYIFFHVWRFPVDCHFYISAASFNGKYRWEQGLAIQ
jgi:hypothetical protein